MAAKTRRSDVAPTITVRARTRPVATTITHSNVITFPPINNKPINNKFSNQENSRIRTAHPFRTERKRTGGGRGESGSVAQKIS
jgi:hypothetical protein